MSLDPGDLLIQASWKTQLQPIEGGQGGRLITAEGIALNHAHVPADRALFHVRHPLKDQVQEYRIHRRAHHKPPLGMQRMQGRQHRSLTGCMAEAMTAKGEINQHQRLIAAGTESSKVSA